MLVLRLYESLHQLTRNGRIDVDPARCHHSNGALQFFRYRAFQHVPGSARFKHLANIAAIFMHAQGQDSQIGTNFFQLGCDLMAVQLGHGDIQHEHVWLEMDDLADRIGAIRSFPHHDHFRVAVDERFEACTDH